MGVEADGLGPGGHRPGLELAEQPPAEPEPSYRVGDPDPFDLRPALGAVVLDRAAADRLTAKIGDEELAAGRSQLVWLGGDSRSGVEPFWEPALSSAT